RRNKLIVHSITCDKVKDTFEDEWSTPAEVNYLCGVRLNRRVFISSSTPYFNRMVVKEIQLSRITCDIHKVVSIVSAGIPVIPEVNSVRRVEWVHPSAAAIPAWVCSRNPYSVLALVASHKFVVEPAYARDVI